MAPLLALAVTGGLSRYAADDYCTAAQVHLAGLVEAQSRLYVGWSGRFAATLLVTVLERVVGAAGVPLLPALTLLIWLAVGAWTVGQLGEAAGRPMSLPAAAALAALVIFATLQTTADLPQILFWQTGMVTYLWPLVIATLHVGWLAGVARPRSVHWLVGSGVSFALAFLAGGTSETFAAAQVTALGCGVVVALVARRGPVAVTILGGLAGAVVALAIVALSPGNSVRQETAIQTPLAIALPEALQFTQAWLRLTFARPHAIALLLLVGLPAAISATSATFTSNGTPATATAATFATSASATSASAAAVPSRTMRRIAFVVTVGLASAALVILACMLPAFYALGADPPGRAQVLPQCVLVCSLATLAWYLGGLVSPHRLIKRTAVRPWPATTAAMLLLLLLALGPLAMASDVVQTLTFARAYAAAWDQLDRDVRTERAQGVLDVTVRPLPSTGLVQNLEFVGPNRADWFNDCVARYYDLNTIASTLSLP